MASKKERKRRQKNKERREGGDNNAPRVFYPGVELNSLDLLSNVHGIPKAAEADGSHREQIPAAGESLAAVAETADSADVAQTDKNEDIAAFEPDVASSLQTRDDVDVKENARKAVEEEEQNRRAAAEEERRRQEESAARRAREMAEEVERVHEEARMAEEARRAAEAAEFARLGAEEERRAQCLAAEAEKSRQAAEAAERARLEAEEAERVRRLAAEAEEARQAAEAAERVRLEAEAAERARRLAAVAEEAERAQRDNEERYAAASAFSGPPLEVDNPYWEKSPEIFEVMSGVPHGAFHHGHGSDRFDEQVLPVTMAGVNQPDGFEGPGYESAAGSTTTIPEPMEKRMYIVMVTPEVAPCAKVGGLGDVILGLGRELMKRGHGVEVICPMYAGMRYDQIYDLHEEYGELWCPHYNEWRAEKVFQGKVEGGLQVNFITGGDYTERDSIYGYADDLQRFTYFSRQALEFMFKTNRRPDIIHCHDWATALTPVLLWDIYQKLGWDNSRVVYTIHNNECQGLCGFGDKLLSLVGLDVKNYYRPDRMQDDTHPNCINLMKGGIVYSNFVTTVSPTYAGELKTVVGGRGLERTIAKNSAKIGGVLNGIDYDSWNPQTDAKLAARYSAGDDFFEKYKNKTALREWLGLYDAWKPIVSVVTRLTHQKGLDLIKAAIFATLEMQGQYVLLGSAPDPKVNADFLRLQHELRDNHDVSLYIGYHEDLSRLIYAGSDMFLIPSLYEPCGLTQMISLRYGTVPIVRETGGLVDTVFDLDNSGRGLSDANGFAFRDPSVVSMRYGLDRAVRLWYDNPDAFNRLARNGMRYDYSWRDPAEHYENIYNYIKA